ncbi:MAG: hypothetical protein RL435_511 [Actinomycetota bacterium]
MATTSEADVVLYHDDEHHENWSDRAKENLWLAFSRMGNYEQGGSIPVITRGEGVYVWDDRDKKIFDGLAGLFTVQIGHGREELVEAAAKQMRQLSYFPLWGYANPPAIELAERLTSFTPKGLNHVFFSATGGESVESAIKLIKQYYKMTGKPLKHKVISRSIAYHGTTQGALSITGIPAAKQYF